MNRARVAVLLLTFASLGGRGVAQERTLDAAVADASTPPSPLGAALVERFEVCASNEGAVLTDADRALLRDTLPPRAAETADAVGGTGCEGAMNESSCVDAIRSATCEALARSLAAPTGRRTVGSSWAEGYARVLTQRIAACYALEADGGALDDIRETLARFERETSESLGARGMSGCRVNENLLPACSSAVVAMPCEALGGRLENDPADQLRALGEACRQMLRCDGDAADAGR